MCDVSAGLAGEIVKVKRAVLLEPDKAVSQVQHLLWQVLAAAGGDPATLSWAAGLHRGQPPVEARRRLLTRTSAVIAAGAVAAAVAAVFLLDRVLGGNILLAVVPIILAGVTWLIRIGWDREPDREPLGRTRGAGDAVR